LAVLRLADEDLEVVHALALLERLGTAVVAGGVAREVERDLGPLALVEAADAAVVVVLAGEAERLKRRLGRPFQEVAQVELVDLPHHGTGHGVDARHQGADVAVGPLADAQRGGVTGVARYVLRLGRAEPGVVGSAALEVAGGPDAVREGGGPLDL